MIKLVSFDWNGTIISDIDATLKADNEVLKVLGKKPVSIKGFRETFDVPIIKYYTNLGHAEEEFLKNAETIAKTFHSHYEKLATKLRTRANARKVLAHLKENKVDSIVFSNHTLGGIGKQLRRLNLEAYFSNVIANSYGGAALKSRSKGEKLSQYLKERKIRPDDVLIVGDTIEEIEIAKELGTFSAAITGGYNSAKRLKSANPDYLINDLRKIEGIITNIDKTNQTPQTPEP